MPITRVGKQFRCYPIGRQDCQTAGQRRNDSAADRKRASEFEQQRDQVNRQRIHAVILSEIDLRLHRPIVQRHCLGVGPGLIVKVTIRDFGELDIAQENANRQDDGNLKPSVG